MTTPTEYAIAKSHQGHRIAIADYSAERFDCTCGSVIQAEPDATFPDRHGNLVRAWQAHRRDSGLTTNAGMHGPQRKGVPNPNVRRVPA